MKQPKKQPKKPSEPPIPPEPAADGLDLMIEQLKAVAKQAAAGVARTKGGDSKLVKETVNVMTELRKLEVARDKRAAALTDAVLVDYFRKLSPERRADWVKTIAAFDRKGSVLG